MKFALALALWPTTPTSSSSTNRLRASIPVFRRELLERLSGVIQDERKAVLFSTHITSDLERTADYITFVHGRCGRLFLAVATTSATRGPWSRAGPEMLDPARRTSVPGRPRNAFGVEALTRGMRRRPVRFSLGRRSTGLRSRTYASSWTRERPMFRLIRKDFILHKTYLLGIGIVYALYPRSFSPASVPASFLPFSAHSSMPFCPSSSTAGRTSSNPSPSVSASRQPEGKPSPPASFLSWAMMIPFISSVPPSFPSSPGPNPRLGAVFQLPAILLTLA